MNTRRILTLVKLESLGHRLRASLWLVPTTCVACAMALALFLPWLDQRTNGEGWDLYPGQAESARELLSTIASSMLTLAGLVFSITILVLQLASSQFSPRVLRTFMADRNTQVAMGLFLGSFVYAMVLLPQVRSGEAHEEYVPSLAVFVAVALVLVCVMMFVRYIHHMAHSIRAVHVLRSVADEAHAALALMYPDAGVDEPAAEVRLPSHTANQTVENAGAAGVVTGLDEDALMRLACEHDVVIALTPRMGEFVPRGAPLFSVWGNSKIAKQRLCECVVLESERTPNQDAAFGLRQLVDVAERALSPGINDPSTAVQALDCVHDLLRALVVRKIPAPARFDEAKRLRLFLPCPDWSDYVHLGLDEVRQYGGASIQVMRRLRTLIKDLVSLAPPSRQPVLKEQLLLLDQQIARSFAGEGERLLARSPNGSHQATLPQPSSRHTEA